MPPPVSLQNDVGGRSTEIHYWWHIATQIWVVLLIDWSNFLRDTTNQKHTAYTFDVVFKNGNDFLSDIIDNNGVKKENIPVSFTFNSPQYPFKPMLHPQNSLVPLPS